MELNSITCCSIDTSVSKEYVFSQVKDIVNFWSSE